MNSSSYASGAQQLANSIEIVNYFNFIKQYEQSLSQFLAIVMEVYSECEFNYSSTCISSIFNEFNFSENWLYDSFYINWYFLYTPYIIPFYQVNDLYLYWINYLEKFYCSISLISYYGCTLCNSFCTYYSLRNSIDCHYCNVSSCGYSNLECLEKDNCYSFMIGDGNCNKACNNDPDCLITIFTGESDENLIIIIVCIVGLFFL